MNINKPKKKYNWMAGFVIINPLTDAEKVSMEIGLRTVDARNQHIKRGR